MSMLISSNKSTDTHTLVNKHLDYNPIYKVKYIVNGKIDTTPIVSSNAAIVIIKINKTNCLRLDCHNHVNLSTFLIYFFYIAVTVLLQLI